MTIDLRYLFPVAAFYAPGLLMLGGAFLLGYSLEEVRDAIAVMGGLFGSGMAVAVSGYVFCEVDPIPYTFFSGRNL